MKKIYIEITNSCNLNCSFCLNTQREKSFMSIEKFEEVIKKVKDYTELVCLHVKGEPLLHLQLEDILWIIGKYNLKTNITTNGTLLKKNLCVIQKSNSVRQINISLHSCLENENLNVQEYLNTVYECVKQLENTDIIVSYRLWNLKDISNNEKNEEVINFLEQKYSFENLKDQMALKEWIKLKERIFINQDTMFIWPNLNEEIINETGRCLALKNQVAILVDGSVVPCCIDSEGKIILGNIFEDSLENILNSDRALKIIQGFEKNFISEELCKRCGFLKRLENKRK